jgi:hypothetical protein
MERERRRRRRKKTKMCSATSPNLPTLRKLEETEYGDKGLVVTRICVPLVCPRVPLMYVSAVVLPRYGSVAVHPLCHPAGWGETVTQNWLQSLQAHAQWTSRRQLPPTITLATWVSLET